MSFLPVRLCHYFLWWKPNVSIDPQTSQPTDQNKPVTVVIPLGIITVEKTICWYASKTEITITYLVSFSDGLCHAIVKEPSGNITKNLGCSDKDIVILSRSVAINPHPTLADRITVEIYNTQVSMTFL